MCGFFGVYSKGKLVSEVKSEVIKAGQKISHRGPDDFGIYSDDHWCVYFRRLSIIDESELGHQPMLSEDGQVVLVFNGEIYNFLELKKSLQQSGHQFRGDCDTEVLLRAYIEYGVNCVDHLRGMFAFVVWDRRHQTLHVFRDRLGIKPFYICRYGESVILSSEIKSILAYSPKLGKFNQKTIFKYLARGWVDNSNATFYEDISAVEPASVVSFSNRGIQKKIYWQLNPTSQRRFEPDEFLNCFKETISLHLRSDVPLATTLSGGMDSSSITAVASQQRDSREKLHAFSVIPPQTLDESPWIDLTVKSTGIKHSYLDLEIPCMSTLFDEVLGIHDEPFQSSSCLYQYLLRRQVGELGIKVLLVGEGGDEVLGGYRRLFYPFLYSLRQDNRKIEFEKALHGGKDFLGKDTSTILRGVEKYEELIQSGQSGQENTTAYEILSEEYCNEHREIIEAPAYPSSANSIGNYFFAHLYQHLFSIDIPYVLRMEDRNSMAHGVESRVPFLDHQFVEHAFSYDYAAFMQGGSNKNMLRQAMHQVLHPEILHRKDKSPRPGSNTHVVYGDLRTRISGYLESASFRESSIWKDDCLELFNQDCMTQNSERAEMWFRLLSYCSLTQAS